MIIANVFVATTCFNFINWLYVSSYSIGVSNFGTGLLFWRIVPNAWHTPSFLFVAVGSLLFEKASNGIYGEQYEPYFHEKVSYGG